MSAGERHRLGDYEYTETIYGPFTAYAPCVDCGHEVLVSGMVPEPRCSVCLRTARGASLDYYGTGRDEVVKTVDTPELARLRRLANQERRR